MDVYGSAHLHIVLDEARHFLEWRWTPSFAPSRQLRAMLKELGPKLRGIGARKWLLDHTHMKVVAPEDQDSIVSSWLPSWSAVLGTDQRCRVAVVLARDHFGRISTLRIVSRAAEQLTGASLSTFDDVASATIWLHEDRSRGGGAHA